MNKRYYLCRLKSDIILKAEANTEPGAKNLDFIPGNVFLGIVAKNYDKFSDPFYVFHSGKVKFSDANVLVESLNGGKIVKKPSYKMPLCFHNLKIGDGNFNKLFLDLEVEKNMRNESKQLKQLRSGYINEDFFEFKINYNYSQKSAHDKKKRRSEDEKMYGYESLNKGLEFLFSICADKTEILDEIEKYLLGNKFIGKSKTSQYGRVFIEKSDKADDIKSFTPKDGYDYIYAKSRIALYDENGNPIALRCVKDLGLEKGIIDFSKSYIKTQSYLPFNAKKNGREMMRYFIEKGSVIAVKNANLNENSYYIGKFQNEGYGEILINPKFLDVVSSNKNEEFDFSKNSKKLNKFKKDIEKFEPKYPKTDLIKFLEYREFLEEQKLKLGIKIEEFYNNMPKNIKNSQWGSILNFASSVSEDVLLEKIETFINKGVESKQWKKVDNKFREIYQDDEICDKKLFIRLLALRAQKGTKDE